MADRTAGASGAPEPEQPSSSRRPQRRPPPPRAVAVVVVVVLVVIGVVQNSQNVTVRFLTFTGHIGLIWVIVASLVIAGFLGYVAGRRGRRGRQAGRRRVRRRAGEE